jgi:hypothetical protein
MLQLTFTPTVIKIMQTPYIIPILTVFCLSMLALVAWLYTRQRKAFKTNQARIVGLQDMLKKQYQHRVESIGVIASAMKDKQCEYTEGCIRLKQLIEQVEPELLTLDEFSVIELVFRETEHMPINEQWQQLDKKAKSKFTQQRSALETKHKDAIHAAVVSLKTHQFAGYQSLG